MSVIGWDERTGMRREKGKCVKGLGRKDVYVKGLG
jgi:hypothetical protein